MLHILGNDIQHISAFFAANAVGFKRPKVIEFAQQIWSPGAYIDARKIPSHPKKWDMILSPMIARARELRREIDVVASVETGGIAHGVAIARELKVPHVIVRKKPSKGHGLDGRIAGDTEMLKGAKILLVEDTSSTFESSLNSIAVVEHEGGRVTHTFALSTWNFPAFRRNVEHHRVHVVCTGLEFLNYARAMGQIDQEHEDIVRHWLEHPEDRSWAHGGAWVLPESAPAQ